MFPQYVYEVSAVAPLKAPVPSVVIPVGIVSEVKTSSPEKADWPMEVTLLGKDRAAKRTSANAPTPIFVSVPGKVNEVIERLAKPPSAIPVSPIGKVRVPKQFGSDVATPFTTSYVPDAPVASSLQKC